VRCRLALAEWNGDRYASPFLGKAGEKQLPLDDALQVAGEAEASIAVHPLGATGTQRIAPGLPRIVPELRRAYVRVVTDSQHGVTDAGDGEAVEAVL
jgi:hypothetical protein